ncbi:MAG: hypothetical protein ACI9IL_000012 [Rickettsiales bacterium]|jgi:hypothetical protein
MSVGELKNRKISKKSRSSASPIKILYRPVTTFRSSAKLYNIYKKQSKKYNIDDIEIMEGKINYQALFFGFCIIKFG